MSQLKRVIPLFLTILVIGLGALLLWAISFLPWEASVMIAGAAFIAGLLVLAIVRSLIRSWRAS